MFIAKAKLQSVAPYSQSKHYSTPKKNKELPKNYETRTWKDRLHTTESGEVFIPPMAFKNSLAEAAKFQSTQIPGKGMKTWTARFECGVLVTEPMLLGINKKDVEGEWFFVPSNGQRGGGKRVDKCFPVIHEWSGTVEYYVLDELITEDVFRDHLICSGQFIGVGRFRPKNNGFYGRFKVESVEWEEV